MQVVFCIISNLFDHLLRMGTRLVPIKGEAQYPLASGVGDKLQPIPGKRLRRSSAAQQHAVLLGHRRLKAALHPLQICHQPAQLLRLHSCLKAVIRLQQHTAAGSCQLLQTLTDCPIGRLPKISALGVLDVRSAVEQGDVYIAQLRTGQNTLVLLFKDVCG